MADLHNKNNEQEGKETVEFFKDLDKEALNIEGFLEKNAKIMSIAFGILIFAVLAWFGYKQFIVGPKNEEATKSYLSAQKNLAEGKEDLALGGKSVANPGFLGTYDQYGSTDAGKLAAYNAGLIEFKKGHYQKAYDLLDNFSSGNKVLVALKYGAMADKASSTSDDAYTSYYFTKKAGMLALALKKNADAKKYFAAIEEKYQDYDNGQSDAFIEMTKYY